MENRLYVAHVVFFVSKKLSQAMQTREGGGYHRRINLPP